jgi:hypothetical protein
MRRIWMLCLFDVALLEGDIIACLIANSIPSFQAKLYQLERVNGA